jgi:hypothetical protein
VPTILEKGENTLNVNHFSSKEVMYKKLKILHDNILELKIHFESRLILIQWLDEKD